MKRDRSLQILQLRVGLMVMTKERLGIGLFRGSKAIIAMPSRYSDLMAMVPTIAPRNTTGVSPAGRHQQHRGIGASLRGQPYGAPCGRGCVRTAAATSPARARSRTGTATARRRGPLNTAWVPSYRLIAEPVKTRRTKTRSRMNSANALAPSTSNLPRVWVAA
jgi:hypothetical protein